VKKITNTIIVKLLIRTSGIMLLAYSISGCASLVSKSNWPLSIQTSPSGAKVTITNRDGSEVYIGKTPTAIKLKSGAGYFSKESYTVLLTMAGHQPKKINVECKINRWYFGNILIGGLVGLLIVDPATGAMYKLDSPGIDEKMEVISPTGSTPTLKILEKSEIGKAWEKHLVKLN
jgi:hypothetical protein